MSIKVLKECCIDEYQGVERMLHLNEYQGAERMLQDSNTFSQV
jgi:hypothetical protein